MAKTPITFDDDVLRVLDETCERSGLGARGRSKAVNLILRMALLGEDLTLDIPEWPEERAARLAPVKAESAPKAKPAERKPAPRAILAEAERSASHLGARAMEAAGVPFGNIRGPMQKGARAGHAGAHGRGPGPDRAR